jgi:hypothetical protein
VSHNGLRGGSSEDIATFLLILLGYVVGALHNHSFESYSPQLSWSIYWGNAPRMIGPRKGKPVVRRGRKARGLITEAARLPKGEMCSELSWSMITTCFGRCSAVSSTITTPSK